jgi:predicted nuclease of predicted toxin-antitoxin system
MILADENRNAGPIDHSLIEAVRAIGIEVYSIYEQQRGIADETIIEFSRNPPRLILTEDKDFGEWVFAHNIRDISVLLLRYHFDDTAQMIRQLLFVLSERLPDLFGNFTVLTVDKIRMRPL